MSAALLARIAAVTRELEAIAMQWPEGETVIKGDLRFEDIWPHFDMALTHLQSLEREIERVGLTGLSHEAAATFADSLQHNSNTSPRCEG